ncbi:MAG: lysylphosphatidylglycerol synthase domain-containing protein, partial [Vicinamibacterales bacterium]
MNEPPLAARRSRAKTVFTITLAIVGAVLLVVTVRRVGWSNVQHGFAQVGWWFVVVLILGGVRFAARARAWMASAEGVLQHTSHSAPSSSSHAALRTPHFFGAVLAGDALGNLTPLGLLASEPAKIVLVRDRLPTVAAITSVAVENVFYIGSIVAMLAAGAVVFITVTALPAGLRAGVRVVLAGAAASAIIAAVVARHQPAVLSRLAHLLSALTGRGQTSSDRLTEIETQFYRMLTWPAHRLARVMTWEAVFHLAAVTEVWLVLRLLPGGSAASVADAFVLETTGRLIAVVFKFVPYRLGVDEAGTALVATTLAIDPTAGVTLALIRRMRILCWDAVGLLVLA